MKCYYTKQSYHYTEPRDCGASLELPEDNELVVKTCDNGMANYLVLKTKRWAMDEESLDKFYHEMKRRLKHANV